jgi:uncharacterized membrane protein YphA (DoxX/SURF4 family)
MPNLEKFREYAPVINRLGLSAVFLWFGINQLFNPNQFIGYLPEFLFSLEYAKYFVIANGIFEIIFGTLLIIGLYTRLAAVILGLHLLAITSQLGYGETAVRDFGLALSTLSIALGGADKWCLDTRKKKK